MLAVAFALTLTTTTTSSSATSKLYAQMSADTLEKGRAMEAVMRTMVPLGRRIDECVLIAAPKDQDWEGEYLASDGTHMGLKIGFDVDGSIAFLSLRWRPALPDDPHASDAPVKLTMPVTDRVLVPFSGGPTRMWNQHVTNPDQRHAIDVVAWKDGGSYGATLGLKNEDYVIWDAPVHAPVDGTVVLAENDVDDHLRPQKDWSDDAHPFGNFVVIRVDDAHFVVIGHMRKGSVAVSEGQEVKAGDVVGHVGNSGNSSEPHLHVHVQDGPVLKQGFSVPFVVDGKKILRGTLIERRR